MGTSAEASGERPIASAAGIQRDRFRPAPEGNARHEDPPLRQARLWFLFLFNAVVVAAAPFVVDGTQGVATAAR